MGLLEISNVNRFKRALCRVTDGLERDHPALKTKNRSFFQSNFGKHCCPHLAAQSNFAEDQR